MSYRVTALISPGATQALSTAVTDSRSLYAYMEIQDEDEVERALRQDSILFLSLEVVNAAKGSEPVNTQF